MKSILISVKPKWAMLEMNGKKLIEVRKNYIEPPFKVYNYVTQESRKTYFNLVNHCGQIMFAPKSWDNALNGKVAFEYVVNKVDKYAYDHDFDCDNCSEMMYYIKSGELEKTCLTYRELERYGKDKTLYGWYISDLIIYDKPKELGEFYVYNKELEKRFIDGDGFCCYDGKDENGEPLNDCSGDNIKRCYECWEEWSGWCKCVTRPPQNFIYISEVQDDT